MKALYFVYQVCVAAPLILLSTIITALVTTVGSLLGDANVWGYHPGKWWGRFICFVLLLPVRVRGREHIRPHTSYVFVANHQSMFDIFLLYGYLNRSFKWMMKRSIRRIPMVGKACESAGHIFVDKRNTGGVRHTYTQARAVLHGGISLVVFPEGSRTYTGRMGAFKRGAFLLAHELGLEVVPITIDGPFQVLPRTGKTVHRHPLTMTIHPPITPLPDQPSDVSRLSREAWKAIESGLPEAFRQPVPDASGDTPTNLQP